MAKLVVSSMERWVHRARDPRQGDFPEGDATIQDHLCIFHINKARTSRCIQGMSAQIIIRASDQTIKKLVERNDG